MEVTNGGLPSTSVETIRQLADQIRHRTDEVRATMPTISQDLETLKLALDTLEVQAEATGTDVIGYLTDAAKVGDPEREATAREWVAWARVHLKTLESLTILADAAAAETVAAAAQMPAAV
jgi:hypothetical protein